MIELPVVTLYALLGAVMIYGYIFIIKFNWFWDQDRAIVFGTGLASGAIAITITIFGIAVILTSHVKWV